MGADTEGNGPGCGQPGVASGQQGGVAALGDGVYAIDTHMAGYAGITAGYVILGDRPCLVETGTSTSAPVVRDALAGLGIGPRDLATVVVTHIHLDHAGGVGDISGMYPEAEIVVHERGARHLADPTRLLRSARMVYGDALDTLFGELRPTEAARIRTVDESGMVDLGGGRRLESHYSPGHAKHHVGLLDSLTGDLYVGDAAGVYIPETADLLPATPPPDFDLDTALESLAKFRGLRPRRLLFSHFGPVEVVDETLERADEELRLWVEWTREAHGQGMDLDHAVAMVRDRGRQRYAALGHPPEPGSTAKAAEKLEVIANPASNVAGIWQSLESA